MNENSFKYSIIIPHCNGDNYLPACVDSVLTQNYSNFELIISDDKSTAKTKEYLSNIKLANVKIISPPNGLSMTEHWEWALKHASGEWQIFLGQDDGLQMYFFQLADILTEFANRLNLKLIMSERAYFFWPGTELLFNNIAVNFSAITQLSIKNTKVEALKALIGLQSYFELPQMYTTSLFHKDFLDNAKKKQKGKIFITHPQDANLAALACSLERNYLLSKVPLGWVGTSPKSAGMAVTAEIDNAQSENNDVSNLKTEYLGKIYESKLSYNDYLVGDFNLGNVSLYFLQSILQTKELRSEFYNNFITSNFFKIIFFSSILNDLNFFKPKIFNIDIFKELVKNNKINYSSVYYFSFIFLYLKKLYNFIKILRNFLNSFQYSQINYSLYWKNSKNITLNSESLHISNLIQKNDFLKKIKF
jgi:glycosyltransferase involved in cell wall biosynthesis